MNGLSSATFRQGEVFRAAICSQPQGAPSEVLCGAASWKHAEELGLLTLQQCYS